jgi:Ca-activated chloride channel family protein
VNLASSSFFLQDIFQKEAVITQPFSKAVQLASQTTYPNRDYVLRFQRANARCDFSVASYRAPGADHGYFMLNLYPDLNQIDENRTNLELILLVDISGSQSGWPMQAEKEIALNMLSRLESGDKFSLLAFNTSLFYAFSNEYPVDITMDNVSTAQQFIQGLNAGGGTNLLQGIKAALAVPTSGELERIFVFLTDGFITNEEAIFEEIANHPSGPTIFTFGAGNNLNRYFLDRAAEIGNGFSTPIVQGEAIEPLVDQAWERISGPQLSDIQISFGSHTTSDLIFPLSSKLYKGSPYQVFGKYQDGGNYNVVLTALKDGQPFTLKKTIHFPLADPFSWSVEKLWAREKISRLMVEEGTTASNKEEIISISLEYQVLSPYTAFLASSAISREAGNMYALNPILGSHVDASIVLPETIDTSNLSGIEISEYATGPEFDVHDRLLNLEWGIDEPVQMIKIFDCMGNLIYSWTPSSGKDGSTRFQWDGLTPSGIIPKGIYYVRIHTDIRIINKRFFWG